MQATQATLQQAQAAPASQQAAILQGITGENLTGDLLTATIWGYFVNLQNGGMVASSQARMFDRPALSYGLFHAQVQTKQLYGLITTGVTFEGLNMDVGHMRFIRWATDDNPASPINSDPALTATATPRRKTAGLPTTRCRGSTAARWNLPRRKNSGWTTARVAIPIKMEPSKTRRWRPALKPSAPSQPSP
jgi:hypothetical protein